MEAREIFEKIRRLRSYFGNDGGVTASGGEPLMQCEFLTELFTLCREVGIGCALDTSGCVYSEKVERLLTLCDLVILDYKYTDAEGYEKHVGMKKERVDLFLDRLQELGKRVWIRQVIIPGINDSRESVARLYALRERYSCIEKIELLPFRKLCVEKYEALNKEFPFKDIPEASSESVLALARAFEGK